MPTPSAAAMTSETPQARFLVLLERNQRILFKVASIHCRNPEDRRDLEQEICAQLWRAFPRYEEGRPFSTWMYRIALNVAISSVRRAGHRAKRSLSLDESVPEPIDDQGAAWDSDELVAKLRCFIEQLDELSRALLLLYMEEHSYREIAEVLGISETHVATKISRLKQRIRNDFDRSNTH